jgi:hypothetical protein
VTRLIVEKILLTPTEQLKALGDTETMAAYSEALTRLFALTQNAPGVGDVADVAEDEDAAARAEPAKVEPFRKRP